MTGLLELKERLIRFFGKNEIYVVPVLKFILATVVFLLINQNIGYMTRLAGLPVTLVLALLCAVLPVNAILLFAFILIAAHLFALSMDVCVVGLILMLVIALLYLRFSRWLLCSADTDNICITYPIYHADFSRTVTDTGICCIYCERNCDVLFPEGNKGK